MFLSLTSTFMTFDFLVSVIHVSAPEPPPPPQLNKLVLCKNKEIVKSCEILAYCHLLDLLLNKTNFKKMLLRHFKYNSCWIVKTSAPLITFIPCCQTVSAKAKRSPNAFFKASYALACQCVTTPDK